MTSLNEHSNVVATENNVTQKRQKKIVSFQGRIKNILSRFNFEDLLLLAVLFLLIEEGVEDEFLILMIVLLILAE